jgi:hypothetical protein
MRRSSVFCILAAGLLAGLQTGELHAQDGFLFRAPQVQVTFRAGPVMPRAQSDVFDFMTSELTLERGDFRAPALAAEFAVLLGPRWDLALSLGHSEAESRSEYRDLIGSDGLPIEQTTRLRTMPLTGTLRFYPIERGRTVGSLAWLPTRTTPYIGAGGGMTWYRLEQQGEFVELPDYDIFYHEYRSAANALTLHAVAGADHWFTPRIGLNLEGRYTHGSAPTEGAYRSYDRLDLSGLQASVGLSFRW